MEIKLGKYKHYKGKFYEVLGFARHSETLQDMVIYRQLYGEFKTWVRPASMWNEIIKIDNIEVKRFEYVAENIVEKIEIFFENEKIKIEEIFSYGINSPVDFWYNNPVDEWVKVTAGNAILQFTDSDLEFNTGDSYLIKSGVKHRVKYTSVDCKWLCIYIK